VGGSQVAHPVASCYTQTKNSRTSHAMHIAESVRFAGTRRIARRVGGWMEQILGLLEMSWVRGGFENEWNLYGMV